MGIVLGSLCPFRCPLVRVCLCLVPQRPFVRACVLGYTVHASFSVSVCPSLYRPSFLFASVSFVTLSHGLLSISVPISLPLIAPSCSFSYGPSPPF